MSSLELEGIAKSFGATRAVGGVSLAVASGEFVSLLGPSGCGKTTLLRVIAGLETPDAGRVRIGGRDVTEMPPEARRIGMVFQNYALFPNMTVFENIAFGLRARGAAESDVRAKVSETLAMVDLSEKSDRPSPDLSGGEQQRVALARAIVTEPDVLLFDEPLSNLDARLRVETRMAIRELVTRVGVTTIYVTHDQEEALSLSDRLAVMRAGTLVQTGAPEAVYDQPATTFVASFLGRANLLPAERDESGALRLPSGKTLDGVIVPGDAENCAALIRPEDVYLCAPDEAWASGRIESQEFLGADRRLRVRTTEHGDAPGAIWEALLRRGENDAAGIGDTVHLAGCPGRVRIIPEDGP